MTNVTLGLTSRLEPRLMVIVSALLATNHY